MFKVWVGFAVNKVLSRTGNRSRLEIKSIIKDNRIYKDGFEICELFNDFFTSVSSRIHDSIPPPISEDEFSYYLQDIQVTTQFEFSPIQIEEIENTILSLKENKSHISTYPNKSLKIISNLVSPLLSIILNKSLTTGCFPKSLKTARVVPIFKAGDRSNLNNYRPISILPIFSKIFERIVHKQLQSYLDHFKFLVSSQFGFRPHLSTSHAVSNTLQYIYNNLDNGSVVVSIFLDFAKAFDCVDHVLLLKKLNKYGIRGIALEWFRSYLTDRKQFLSLNGQNSSLCSIKSGVPQGSILGPLLFLIFINDFPKCSDFFKFTLFADDSTLTCSFNNMTVESITNSINQNLETVNHWLNVNKLKVNTHKSFHIVFSYRKNILLSPIPLGSEITAQTEKTKFLGITLNMNLSFKDHINEKNFGCLF